MAILKAVIFFAIGTIITSVNGRPPHKPVKDATPFMVYFTSRYRALCVGVLVSRTAVLTAAVCCVNHHSHVPDRRPINVVVGDYYRHPKRGVRVQVVRIIVPMFPNDSSRYYLIQKSVALMQLKRPIPDEFVNIPLRAITVNYELRQDQMSLREECFTAGWHYFFKGDKIYPSNKFLLQRNMRLQVVDVVKLELWCEALAIRFRTILEKNGYGGYYDRDAAICIKDADRVAQACHGMFGSPLVCRGRLVGILSAPDAQWTNCTGMSNIYHILSNKMTYPFMKCISKFFKPDISQVDMSKVKRLAESDGDENFDYIPDLYDTLIPDMNSSDDD